jgi:hypothetical protein
MANTVKAWGKWCDSEQAAARSGVLAVWDECVHQDLTPTGDVQVTDAQQRNGRTRCQCSVQAVK